MNLLRNILLFSVLIFSCSLSAQRLKPLVDSTNDITEAPVKKNVETLPPDTGAVDGEIPQGVIYVRKPHISPYIKVDYNLYLAHVNPRGSQRQVPVTDKNTGFTDIQIETIPTFDSTMYSRKLKREYPVSAHLLSKYYAENMKYQYQENDTPRVDTMVVGMWIDPRGKIKRILLDTELAGNMPSQMIEEIADISYTISDWGTGGGYLTQKKFLKPSKLVLESYYCEAYIIVSSYPLTKEQKKTGTSYAPFDYPLNSPALDRQQKLSVDENAVLSHKAN